MASVIRDQRTMVGAVTHSTAEEVVGAWEEWARVNGFVIRRRAGDYSTELRESAATLSAYVSGGCWTASCPNCNGGVPSWPEHERGCCLDCGTVYPLAYPDADEITAADAALAARPTPYRSWFPHEGETAEDLRRENVEQGFHPTTPLAEQLDARDDEAITVADLRRALGDNAVASLLAKAAG